MPSRFGCALCALFVLTTICASDEAASALRSDEWPRLFGPTGDSVVPEQPIDLDWDNDGPTPEWSMPVGESYTSPTVAAGKLILFHRLGDSEVVEARDVETRKQLWQFRYPTSYQDQYGYNNGPRSTPILFDGHVYTLGAEGFLYSLDIKTGEEVWKRNLNTDYKVAQEFFGVGASPLLDGDRLIINVGGTETDAGIVAIDRHNGKTLWTATSDGPSYATPVVANVRGVPHAIVFTKAGLVDLNPRSGKVRWSIPFRSNLYESVNATSPIIVNDLVFASATYGTGSICLRLKPDESYEEVWRNSQAMDSHFSNLMPIGIHVYGFSGRHEGNAELRCIEIATGKVMWSVPSVLGRGSMVRMGHRFVLWGERGHLLVRELNSQEPPSLPLDFDDVRSQLRYPCWTPPVIVAGRLYLRNETTLVCYDLRKNPDR